MQLLRIGNRMINLDNVTEVASSGDTVQVYFNVTTALLENEGDQYSDSYQGTDYTTFRGDEARALWAYLEHRSSDVLVWYEDLRRNGPR